MNKMIQTLSLVLLVSASLVTAVGPEAPKKCVGVRKFMSSVAHVTVGTWPFDTSVNVKVKADRGTDRKKNGNGCFAQCLPACFFKNAPIDDQGVKNAPIDDQGVKNAPIDDQGVTVVDARCGIKSHVKWPATILFKCVPVIAVVGFVAKAVMNRSNKKAAKNVVLDDAVDNEEDIEEEVTA